MPNFDQIKPHSRAFLHKCKSEFFITYSTCASSVWSLNIRADGARRADIEVESVGLANVVEKLSLY